MAQQPNQQQQAGRSTTQKDDLNVNSTKSSDFDSTQTSQGQRDSSSNKSSSSQQWSQNDSRDEGSGMSQAGTSSQRQAPGSTRK